MILFFILGGLTVLSAALNFWQWLAGRDFPLHRSDWDRSFVPAVTLLKPLKGCEPQTRNCLQSWLEQNYPGPVQILFGVESDDDPVCEVVKELLDAHPAARAELVICNRQAGPHPKLSKLIQLMERAEHDVIVISDADVRPRTDYLRHAVSCLRDEHVGLVNSFYRLENPDGIAMEGMAIAMNADFWTQVLQGIALNPQDFALGAVMITRRADLKRIGGFEPMMDYLADDFQLGNRIARSGRKITLTSLPVECWSEPLSARAVWKHQLRQARTIRHCRGLPFFFSILANATVWPLVWLAVFPGPLTLAALGACLALRITTARSNYARIFPPGGKRRCRWWLPPLKDLAHLGIWAGAFLGNRIEWRGVRYRVRKGGLLASATPSATKQPSGSRS